MNQAQAMALFLSMYRSKEGADAEVPFPGTTAAYQAKRVDTSQDILARFHIFASLHPQKTAGYAFNVADGDVISWETIWPGICQFFGLKGVGPSEKSVGVNWMRDHRHEWAAWVKENGLKEGAVENTTWEFMEGVMSSDFDRQYDLSRMREVGFDEKINTVTGYHIAFDRKFSPFLRRLGG